MGAFWICSHGPELTHWHCDILHHFLSRCLCRRRLYAHTTTTANHDSLQIWGICARPRRRPTADQAQCKQGRNKLTKEELQWEAKETASQLAILQQFGQACSTSQTTGVHPSTPNAMIPEMNLPLQTPLFSSASPANINHCSTVLFGCLLFSPIRAFFLCPSAKSNFFFYKEASNHSNGWQLSLRTPLILNKLGSKITSMATKQNKQINIIISLWMKYAPTFWIKLILLSSINTTYNYPHNHTFINAV